MSVVKRYVCGEKEEIVIDGKRKRLDGEDKSFAREVEGFLCLFPNFGDVERGFPDFYNFSLNSGKPMAMVLVSIQERYRICTKVLAVDPNNHVVIIYHERCGSYLASRVRNAVVLARYMNTMVIGRRRESTTLMNIA